MNDGTLPVALFTRADLQHALLRLVKPLAAIRSQGGASFRIGATGASYSPDCAAMESFARPLWGLAPLAAGGGHFEDWEHFRRGLVNGTDPAHPEYWGEPGPRDQRLAEMAPIAFGWLLAPDQLWTPLAPVERRRVSDYLARINLVDLNDNNWLFFRVLVNLALLRVAGRDLPLCNSTDLDRLESFALDDGWYSDGPTDQRDYYAAFAMHFYALVYAVHAAEIDPERCARFRIRAARFAPQFLHWFAADGSALPYGRSLTYRFAQGAFWGALAYANVEALPWGVIKGVWLRHLRWWFAQPILTETGLLTLGYAYPNLNMTEEYNAPGSPYWALKAFLPLALPANHPFWEAEEEPLPTLPAVACQQSPRMLLCRNADGSHVTALAAGQWVDWTPRHTAEKYAKFCYSNHFGFSIPAESVGLAQGAFDSMLALSEDGHHFRVRRRCERFEVTPRAVWSVWRPWPDVAVTTWLIPAGDWHVRVHHIESARSFHTAEGGFALNTHAGGRISSGQAESHVSQVRNSAGSSVIRDIVGGRRGLLVRPFPNTNVLYPRSLLPTLVGTLPPGRFWLACAVAGIVGSANVPPPPVVEMLPGGFAVADGQGAPLLNAAWDRSSSTSGIGTQG